MKTLEEVKRHLLANGYHKSEIGKIMGFLIGVGLKDEGVQIKYQIGEGGFADFKRWFDLNDTEDDILSSIIDDIQERVQNTTDEALIERYEKQLDFLSDVEIVSDGKKRDDASERPFYHDGLIYIHPNDLFNAIKGFAQRV